MMLKNIFFKTALLSALLFTTAQSSAAQDKKNGGKEKFTVVLDPGHGGHDAGTVGTGRRKIYEKHVVLKVALKLEKLLNENMDDVRVLLTRRTDVYPRFIDRVNTANKNNADIFISIHCNSVENVKRDGPRVRGAETYVMATQKASANLEISKKENAAMLLEENYRETYKNFDPSDLASNIGKSLEQFSTIKNSISLATMAQEGFEDTGSRKNLGVKQAVLYVTYATVVPAVLVELGFLSNPEEEDFLHSEKGQQQMAQSLYEAISKYKVRFFDSRQHGTKDSAPVDFDAIMAEQTGNVNQTSSAAESKTSADKSSGGVYYCVQLISSPKTVNVKTEPTLRKFQSVEYYRENGMYKYTTPKTATFAKAQQQLSQAKSKGAKTAFIVAFRDGKKIDTAAARKLTGE